MMSRLCSCLCNVQVRQTEALHDLGLYRCRALIDRVGTKGAAGHRARCAPTLRGVDECRDGHRHIVLQVLQRERLSATDVKAVVAQVHQAAIDVLGPVIRPQTVHRSKFSMGTVLGLIAVHGRAGLTE